MSKYAVLTLVMLFSISGVGQAAVSDEEFAALKSQLEAVTARLAELEAASQQTSQQVVQLEQVTEENAGAVAAVQTTSEKRSWAERIKFKGDFRYRYQNDEVDLDAIDSRNRQRIRARPALVATLPQDVEVGFGLATGGDDPVSSNQTLGRSGSSKGINLDLAYFDWSGLEGTNIRGGKFKNTLTTVGKSQLQWDGDWRPEGLDITWANDLFFAQAVGNWLESDSRADDEFAYILQAGAKASLGPAAITAGVGYSDVDAAGRPCFFDSDNDGFCLGNEVDGAGQYLYDFQVYNIFADATFTVADLPLSVFGDFIKNDDADEFDTGYLLGAQLGKADKQGSWQIKYYYEDIESNATLGLLTNSDFGGGGTNGKGSVFSGAYALTDRTNLALSYYLVERNSDNIAEVNGGEEFDVDTLQIDINFKYK